MNKKDKACLENGDEYRQVKVVTGGFEIVSIKSLAGYCHYAEHNGYITKNVLKNKDCYNKGCLHFEKLDEYPFWENYEKGIENKINRKKHIRALKKADDESKQLLIDIKTEACRWVEQLDYPIVIFNVSKMCSGDYYLVTFVSESVTNDSILYYDLAFKLQYKFKEKFRIQRIRKPNGEYARPCDLKFN